MKRKLLLVPVVVVLAVWAAGVAWASSTNQVYWPAPNPPLMVGADHYDGAISGGATQATGGECNAVLEFQDPTGNSASGYAVDLACQMEVPQGWSLDGLAEVPVPMQGCYVWNTNGSGGGTWGWSTQKQWGCGQTGTTWRTRLWVVVEPRGRATVRADRW
jgi:hypothetical protein